MELTTDPDLDDLLVRSAAGERAAWNELVEALAPTVWDAVRSYQLDQAGESEVWRAVWVHLADNLTRLNSIDQVGHWLEVTTEREATRYRKLSV